MNSVARDDENWVWAGANVIEPDHTRALVSLSRGGSDAAVVREFDMLTREFVADGFELPEAKSQVGWDDPDTVLVGTDFGPGSLTESGYPRIVKRWRRGTPLTEAETCSRATRTDVIVVGVGRSHARLRAHLAAPGRRLLQRRGLRTARLGADPHRRAHRRQRVDAPRVAADRAAHRLDRRRHRPIAPARCWPPTTTNSSPAQPN